MESFRWNEQFLTGIAMVDEQHHHLVDVINQFSTLLSNEESVTLNDISEIFNELADYTRYHFAEEEALMRESHVDARHMQRQFDAHVHFVTEIEHMHDSIVPGDNNGARLLLRFLIDWLAYHILGLDQMLAKQVELIRTGSTPEQAYVAIEQNRHSQIEPILYALESLFSVVSERNHQLREANQSLEEKVAQRTKSLEEANQQLIALSLTDALTGLPNRRHALQWLSMIWEQSSSELPVSCMMIDADNFKQINDKFGHDAGDIVLKTLSSTMNDALRSDDLLCRLGGDEFLLICQNTDLKGAMYLAEQIHKKVNTLMVAAGAGFWQGSISVGVAVRSPEMRDFEALIKSADEGVYKAKRNGRNRIETVC